MLMPKRTKYRKMIKGRMDWQGVSRLHGRTSVDYGLQALEPAWVSSRQIEAARRAITNYLKRGGKVWIRIFPDKPVTQKPAETRMGSGKGNPEYWVAVVKPGRIMFEIAGVPAGTCAKKHCKRAGMKMPMDCRASIVASRRGRQQPATDYRSRRGGTRHEDRLKLRANETKLPARRAARADSALTEWQNLRFQEAVGPADGDFAHPADPQGYCPDAHNSHRARDGRGDSSVPGGRETAGRIEDERQRPAAADETRAGTNAAHAEGGPGREQQNGQDRRGRGRLCSSPPALSQADHQDQQVLWRTTKRTRARKATSSASRRPDRSPRTRAGLFAKSSSVLSEV